MEILFTLYLISGPIKSFIVYFGLPVPFDFTLVSACAILGVAGLQIALGRLVPRFSGRQIVPLVILATFFLWMSLTLSFTPSKTYSGTKVFNFLTVILAFVFGCSLVKIDPKRLLLVNYAIAFVMGLIFIYTLHQNYIVNWTADFRKFNSNYLNLSEHIGVTVLALLHSQRLTGKYQSMRLLLIVAGTFNILLMGGRGPLLFVLICGFLEIIQHTRSLLGRLDSNKLLRGIGLFVLTMVVMAGVTVANRKLVTSTLQRTVERFSLLIPGAGGDGRMGDSAQERVNMAGKSLDLLSKDSESFILGHGVASYGVITSGVDSRDYPHNIFLEAAVEMGFLGAFLLFLFFMSVLLQETSSHVLPRVLIVFLLLNTLKSHSLIDLRLLFGLLGIYLSPLLKETSVQAVRKIKVRDFNPSPFKVPS